jgi:hypothetical protein
MPEHRQVRERGGQVLVPIPSLVWRRLKIGAGSRVWWHLTGRDEALLTRKERRRAGRPRLEDTCPSCEQREKELVRLRALLQTGGAVDGRQYFNQGWHAALGKGLKIEAQYQLVRARLDSIERMVREATSSGVLNRRRPRGAAQPRTSNPRPDPPPSESSGGEEASGAASPQASQSEITVQRL